ncbi:MAG: O-antigen ligase family protein [Cyanobacteria bacterium J06597_1]
MLSSLLSEFKSPFPANADGKRPAMGLETAFVLLSLALYMDPVIEIVFGIRVYNILTQPAYLLTYLVVAYFLYRDRDRTVPFIKNGGLLWLVLFLPLLSTAWSLYPDVTLRRSFALVNNGLFGVYLATRYSLKEFLSLLRYVFIFIVLLSLLFAVAFPWWGLVQEIHVGALRGVFTHKNGAGVRLAIAAIVFLLCYIDRIGSRALNLALFILTSGMTVATQSSTGLGALLLSIAALPFLFIPRGKLSQMMPAIFGTLFVGFVTLLFVVDNADTVLAAFGESSNLTGRATFWPIVIDGIYEKFWIGYGYEAFWAGGFDGPAAILIHLATVKAKFHAHNGFLEMMLSIGFVGTAVFMCSLWSTILNLILKLRESQGVASFFPILFLIQFFAMNMVETSIYSYNNVQWLIFMFITALAVKWEFNRRAQERLRRVPTA